MTSIDADTLRNLIETRAAALALYARQWSRSPEDAVQEAMIELVQLETRPHDVIAWLYTTVRRRAINHLRSDQRRERHHRRAAEQQQWFAPHESGFDDGINYESLLARLPNTEREIVVAKIWGKLTFAQIAGVVDLPLSTVHRRYRRALAELGRMIEEQEEARQSDESQPTPT